MIHERCFRSLLWRYSAVSELARDLVEASHERRLTVYLDKIQQWRRGQVPEMTDAGHSCEDEGLVRLTVDSHALQRIERLQTESLETSVPVSDSRLHRRAG